MSFQHRPPDGSPPLVARRSGDGARRRPRLPPRARAPRGLPAPPLRGLRHEPELRQGRPVRSGALVMAALWEE
ncbi:hypothetical protein HRbin25_00420 [bacterium HR25]|jgi:hypothetical protein|nr:hypothetical protein HRbin25_00420 [bacterium HR25]